MESITTLVAGILPIIETWLRQTIRDEMEKTLEADRAKAKPARTYTRQELAKLANLSLPTLWQRVREGKLHPIKNGRRVVFTEQEVKRFLEMEG